MACEAAPRCPVWRGRSLKCVVPAGWQQATEPVVVSQEMFVIEKLQGNGDGRGRTPLVLPIEIRVRGKP